MVQQRCSLLLVVMGMTLLPDCQQSEADRQAVSGESQSTVGYVTNGTTSFWRIADRDPMISPIDSDSQGALLICLPVQEWDS